MREQLLRFVQGKHHRLSHAVVQNLHGGDELIVLQFAALWLQVVGNAPLQAADGPQAAVMGDVGGLGRPGGDGTRARDHHQQLAAGLMGRQARPVAQEALQHRELGRGQGLLDIGEMHEFRVYTHRSA